MKRMAQLLDLSVDVSSKRLFELFLAIHFEFQWTYRN